ncbi:MAG: hypothetical protein LC713_06815, partial [Actinobacteria bacterium]|nr:hypothetical protein [Actinomycetota bacterium]
MIHRVPNQVQQRFAQRLDDDSIRFELFTSDDKASLLADIECDVAHHPRQRLGQFAQRPLSQS